VEYIPQPSKRLLCIRNSGAFFKKSFDGPLSSSTFINSNKKGKIYQCRWKKRMVCAWQIEVLWKVKISMDFS
jgi:hypothetical protein